MHKRVLNDKVLDLGKFKSYCYLKHKTSDFRRNFERIV